MQTAFVHLPFPPPSNLTVALAKIHKASTGNELAISINLAEDECLILVVFSGVLGDLVPQPFTPIDVITDITFARVIIASAEWDEPDSDKL